MNPNVTSPDGPPARDGEQPCSVVWIDAREALIGRWLDGQAHLERIKSDVPDHRSSSGHLRHDFMMHGGGGPATAGEPKRQEHLRQFVDEVAGRLATDDDLLIVGPGTVREQLERRVHEWDEHHRRSRAISSEASARVTERQLLARLRHFAGADLQRVPARRGEGMPGGQR